MKNFKPTMVFYEPEILQYPFGVELYERYKDQGLEFVKIQSHNRIPELSNRPNKDFPTMKTYLILGVRKSLTYKPNHKTSDYLVPFTSSGCSAMCLYCYLTCTYNKCAYFRLFVNRKQMVNKLIKTVKNSDRDLTLEIGSNSDLVLENTITKNLEWVIPNFAKAERGYITLPTKFHMVEPLLDLDHRGRCIIRMSVNPQSIISNIELGTSNLKMRIKALNQLAEAGYKVGILIAPIIMVENWEEEYDELVSILADSLSEKVKEQVFFELIFLTYGYVQRMINADAFPHLPPLYSKEKMVGRGRGKYTYKPALKDAGGEYMRHVMMRYFPENEIVYIV